MDALAYYLQGKLGDDSSVRGSYFNRLEDALAHLQDHRPAWGIVSLGFYLEQARALKLQPLAATRPGGADSDEWRLVISRDGPDRWQDLQGTVDGTMLFTPCSAARLLFGTAADHLPFTLQGTYRPLRALRAVARGKTVGLVMDNPQYQAVQALPLARNIKVLVRSEPLPTSPVVAFGPVDQRHARLRTVLQGMRDDPEAQTLLQLLLTDGFGPADDRLAQLEAGGS
jgi:hypothetical protein